MHAGHDTLNHREKVCLIWLSETNDSVEIEAIWGVRQRMIDAYRNPDLNAGGCGRTALMATLHTAVPTALIELRRHHRSDQWTHRTLLRLSSRILQPEQVDRPIPPRNRRGRATTKPLIAKSYSALQLSTMDQLA
jgi:hypothetical protein